MAAKIALLCLFSLKEAVIVQGAFDILQFKFFHPITMLKFQPTNLIKIFFSRNMHFG